MDHLDRLIDSVEQEQVSSCQCNRVNSECVCNICNSIETDTDAIGRSTSSNHEVVLYTRRWYILAVFFAFSFLQGGMCSDWSVIGNSVKAAFGWSNGDLSLILTWLYSTYVVLLFPFAWLMEAKGLRVSVLLSCSLMTLGCVCRCITVKMPYVLWLAHLGHVFHGVAGPVAFTAGPVVSATWFPPHERTTATAIGSVAGYAGSAYCFLLGPNLVSDPISFTKNITQHPSLTTSNWSDSKGHFMAGPYFINPVMTDNRHVQVNYTNIPEIKKEILRLRYIECAVCAFILLACIIYFPAKPPNPPSHAAAFEKLSFIKGLGGLFTKKNKGFWLIAVSYGISSGIYVAWSSMAAIIFYNVGVDQERAGLMGFAGTVAGTIMACTVGRIADFIGGHMKIMNLVQMTGLVLSAFYVLLQVESYIPLNEVGLFVAMVLMGVFLNGMVPLSFELAIEHTFPVPETVTSGIMTFMFSIFPGIFLVFNIIPTIGTDWMTWCFYGAMVFAFPLLLLFPERYERQSVDARGKEESQHAGFINRSSESDVTHNHL